jgi:3-methylfumaryl-CoA hydratase
MTLTSTDLDTVTGRSVAALQAMLDSGLPIPTSGGPVPLLWHWLAFVPTAAQADLQDDGHPPLPLVPGDELPRRMFAGGRLQLRRPLRVDEPIERTISYTDPLLKDGRTGRLAFVTARCELRSGGETAIIEEQDLVYRTAPDREVARPSEAPPGTEPADAAAAVMRSDLLPDSRLLFRFSALTFNAHRIHYDRSYATDVEGHLDLVVHGPLQAVLLAEMLRRAGQSSLVRSFEFRAVRPAYANRRLHLRGSLDGGTASLTAYDESWLPTMTATAVLSD